MSTDPKSALAAILPTALRDLLRGRALVLGRPVWGAQAGRHAADRAGLGHLFRAHRPYVAGDDPRLLDWRAMARHDRPMIRQTEGEEQLSLIALLDRSGAMNYGEGPSHKHSYAAVQIAALAHLALRQGDRFGFASGGNGITDTRHLRATGGAQRLHALALALSSKNPDNAPRKTCPWGQLLEDIAPRLPKRALVLAVSDFLDPCPAADETTTRAAERDLWRRFAGLRARGHDLVLLQILHPDERNPPWAGDDLLRIVDPKGSRRDLVGNARTLQRRYQARFAEHQRALTRHCEEHGIHLIQTQTDAPPEDTLLTLLACLRGAPHRRASSISR